MLQAFKIGLGACTFAFSVGFLCFFCVWLLGIVGAVKSTHSQIFESVHSWIFRGDFKSRIIVIMGINAVYYTLALFYIYNVVFVAHFDLTQTVLWVLMILFGGPISMPIYWYRHIL